MPALSAAQTFARIEQAHAAWTRGGATIVVSNITPSGVARAQFRLDLDGAGGATLRIKTPPRKGLASTDQGFFLHGSELVGVDFDARERIVRPSPAQGPIGLRLMAMLGGIDDSIGFLTVPQIRSRYLDPLKSLEGWKVSPSGLLRRTYGTKASLTRLDIDASGRLKGLHVELPGSRLDWAISYGSAKSFSFPANFRKVDAFIARAQPPHYANEAARRVVEGMLKAGGGLQSAIVKIDGNATLWVDGSRVRYENGSVGFSYDGRLLTIQTPGVAYQGRTSRAAVIDQVAALIGSTDPMVRSVLVRTPPYGELFTPEAKVRVVGTIAADGQPCDVLSIDAPRFRSSMFVRKADRLPASIETDTLDRKGRSVIRTTRTLSWSSVNSSLPRSLFALHIRPGQRVLPMPARIIRQPTAP